MSKNYLSKQKIPFTMVCNQIIFDVQVSSKAKFYYVYLSSKPEGWEFHTNAIIKEIKEGKDAFYSGLQELEEFGYLERTQKRIGGKFSATEYMLLIPTNSSDTENPDTEKSDTENPDHNNIYSNKKDLNKKDCNAVQSNFSKNEGGGQNIPTLENSISSEIPNSSASAKNTTTESHTYPLSITEEEYITEWKKINDKAEPEIGFKKSLENFLRCCTVKVQKEHGGWKNYLAEWIGNEKYPKYLDNSERKEWRKGKERLKKEGGSEVVTNCHALITLTTDFRNKPENFQALNEKFHEALKIAFGDDAYNTWFRNVAIVGSKLRTAILLTPKSGHKDHIYLHYDNRLTKITKKVCEKHFKADGFKLNDYNLVLEEELTTTTTINKII
jgi:hypothetical protein